MAYLSNSHKFTQTEMEDGTYQTWLQSLSIGTLIDVETHQLGSATTLVTVIYSASGGGDTGESASASEIVTVTDTAGGLTSGTYGTATKAEMTLAIAQIRVWKDGSTPTAAEGHIVEVGDVIVLNSAADIANFEAIRTGSTSGKLSVTYSE